MSGRGFFITGTDTEVGKTISTCALLRALSQHGVRTLAMKPVASGCVVNAQGELDNEDVLAHAAASNVAAPRALTNPYAFEPPISPHLAAREAGVTVDVSHLLQCYQALRAQADIVLVEGAGGWLAPLSDTHTMADLAASLQIPVILVVGMRLGCLNHAMLTVESLLSRRITLAGWIANHVDPNLQRGPDNLSYLREHIPAPLLGILPYISKGKGSPATDAAFSDFRLETLVA